MVVVVGGWDGCLEKLKVSKMNIFMKAEKIKCSLFVLGDIKGKSYKSNFCKLKGLLLHFL